MTVDTRTVVSVLLEPFPSTRCRPLRSRRMWRHGSVPAFPASSSRASNGRRPTHASFYIAHYALLEYSSAASSWYASRPLRLGRDKILSDRNTNAKASSEISARVIRSYLVCHLFLLMKKIIFKKNYLLMLLLIIFFCIASISELGFSPLILLYSRSEARSFPEFTSKKERRKKKESALR